MNADTPDDLSDDGLPSEARGVIWKILGDGQSPLKNSSVLHNIDPLIRSHVSDSCEQDLAIAIVHEWIESGGGRQCIKYDKQQLVAELVFEGVGSNRSDRAIWAIGSIDRKVSSAMIRSNWTSEEIDSFVDAALTELEQACNPDAVQSEPELPSLAREGGHQTKFPRNSMLGEGRLGQFRNLGNQGYDPFHRGLHPPVANLIELVVDLHPEKLETLVERLDHPIMQIRASQSVVAATRQKDHRTPLRWITKSANDAMVALSILHTVETVDILYKEAELSKHYGGSHYNSSTKLNTHCFLERAAENLIKDLVNQIGILEPLRRVEWIGELLGGAKDIVSQRVGQLSPRSAKLESYCTEQLVRVFEEEWSGDLIDALCSGLRNTRRNTWSRHVAELAWLVRESNHDLSIALAKRALDELDQWTVEQTKHGLLYWDWNDWECSQWITALGEALALTLDNSDLLSWVSHRCRNMSLSVWDAEVDDLQSFRSSNQTAQLLLLIALQSFEFLVEHKRDVDSSDVRTLAEAVWNHCHFVGQHVFADCDSFVVTEFAARTVIVFGKPTREWLWNQASNPKVGSRALWAMIDQLSLQESHPLESKFTNDTDFVREFERAASQRFGDGGTFDFDSLQYWGRLWLHLKSNELAYSTLVALRAFPSRIFDQNSKILILDLLCAGAKSRGLDRETEHSIETTYREVWHPGFTFEADPDDRKRIDQSLEELGIFPIGN